MLELIVGLLLCERVLGNLYLKNGELNSSNVQVADSSPACVLSFRSCDAHRGGFFIISQLNHNGDERELFKCGLLSEVTVEALGSAKGRILNCSLVNERNCSLLHPESPPLLEHKNETNSNFDHFEEIFTPTLGEATSLSLQRIFCANKNGIVHLLDRNFGEIASDVAAIQIKNHITYQSQPIMCPQRVTQVQFNHTRVAFQISLNCENMFNTSENSSDNQNDELQLQARCSESTIRKCCPPGTLYDYTSNTCSDSLAIDWQPANMTSIGEVEGNLTLIHGFPNCSIFALQPDQNPNHTFFLNPDGTIFVPLYHKSYSCDDICVDFFRYQNETREEALLCFPEEKDQRCSFLKSRFYPVLMIISCVFLALTICIYALLSELHSKLNGKCVILSTATLLVGYICFTIMAWKNNPSELYCPILGLLCQFFLLSSFFWLNVMCFDVWRAFRVPRWDASGRSSPKTARLVKYCIYAWGAPLVITIITGCIHFSVTSQRLPTTAGMPSTIVLPGFGSSGCFFSRSDSRSWWAYFYGFISILLLLDVTFFIHLLVLLEREKLTQKALRTNHRSTIWAKLYFKLFIVMGVPWIFEVISWIEGSCTIWIWADSLNALRGLLIFVIFVCKRSILKKLRNPSIILTSFKSSTKTPAKIEPRKKSQFYVDLEV